jgi:WD40 repeat protein
MASGRIRYTLANVVDARFSANSESLVAVVDTAEGRRIEVRERSSGRILGSTVASPPDDRPKIIFSPGAHRAATFQPRVTARLEDVETGELIGQPMLLPVNSDASPYQAFTHIVSPDGKLLLTACSATARVWDAATGRPRTPPLKHPDSINRMAFSPDGRTLLTVCGWYGNSPKTIRLWKTATGQLIGAPIHFPAGRFIPNWSFSSDSRTLTIQYQQEQVRLHDLFTFQPLGAPLAVPKSIPSNISAHVSWVASSPDGKLALMHDWGGGNRLPPQLWDVATGRNLRALPYVDRSVTDLGFGPDGKTILMSVREAPSYQLDAELHPVVVRRWETATGQPMELPLGPHPHEEVVAYSSDGRLALTRQEERVVRVRHGVTGADLSTATVGKEWPVTKVLAWSPDGRFFLGQHENEARVWERTTGKALGRPLPHPAPVKTALFSPDGKTVLTEVGGEARLWDVATGAQRGEPLRHLPNGVLTRFSPDGGTVAIAAQSSSGPVETEMALWDVATGARRAVLPTQTGPQPPTLLFSPDGKILLAAGGTEARLWDTTTGKAIGSPLKQVVQQACFTPDGKLVALVTADGVLLWDVATGARRGGPLPHAHVTALAFVADGALLMTAGDAAGSRQGPHSYEARLWDVRLGRPIGVPLPLGEAVQHLRFSPDGGTLLTLGLRDKTKRMARLWPAPAALAGVPPRVTLWAQVVSGMELDADGRIHVLDAAAWQQRRQKLEALGGPPLP